ncbi:bifunctional proline dehydrogenase/L-glutamate gamma-semialdehyde dehydrogenase [Lysinibacter cavernae]|uniref:L-glutamate gamma-semialdehyde dehydrogenase n=1 Tax=Lysinibacter cavernae TaxID=1640652 RepID=A0A7X5TUV7_9MICO|nr:bifunctional proline dehydrogenase/L-glutamate gamma-semialdehyde dehydrogenase [Lysinibacter cavernae]NIH54863.1 RHH-type proline utilization regulon transcriptional repressor/proline dehydrogenase/delta 1-pyrroline-5-carboxylate dehydrogenase [Lysinibacter cavernae]
MTLQQTPTGATPTSGNEVTSDATVALVEKWLKASEAYAPSKSASLLAETLKDASGLEFTLGFVDLVVRPEDLKVAAKNLKQLSSNAPKFLPGYMRLAIGVGGTMAPAFPGIVVPIARKVLRGMVNHLILDARPQKLGNGIKHLTAEGNRLNINLLGEAVLGDGEADRRLQGTHDLLSRPDVEYVSIKVSSVVNELSLWDYDQTVTNVVERLTPLYQMAASSPTPKFINLDMEEYHDLHLTIDVLKTMLDKPEFLTLDAGIVLQAYLPDALAALQDLTEWSKARRARGGAPIKVRVVKGANLAMEGVAAKTHGWELATYNTKQDSDTNYKRVLDWALTPENTDAVRLGIAGHNLFDIAHAHLLSQARGVENNVEFEMLLGMAEGQAKALTADVGQLLLYTPVVRPENFDAAISYLVRRLEENASPQNFMSAVFELTKNRSLFDREKNRFLASLAALDNEPAGTVPGPNRQQSRLTDAAPLLEGGFENTPDTDSALPDNRTWATAIIGKIEGSTLGVAEIDAAKVTEEGKLNEIIEGALAAQVGWHAGGASARATILRRAAQALEAHRGDLIEVAASETGKTVDQADPEISEAIDFANYYAEQAELLETVEGAAFTPARLTVVTPPWNFPIAIPTGSVLSALAAGSAVVMKPAPQAKRCSAVIANILWNAGIPRDVLALVDIEEGELGKQLVSHPKVERVILTGGFETAELFRSWRDDLPLLAETSGKNSIIVTPSADIDLAVADVVYSAFGHAGQKCSAASLVILVGAMGKSDRFLNQLIDSASSLRVDYPTNPAAQMGPIIEPATGKLDWALNTLDAGEKWAVKPRKMDSTGRLFSPGIRLGVTEGSRFHTTEFFGPVLGVISVPTLEDAIRVQNGTDYGLTAGLHSLDPQELKVWLREVQAGNLYVNRGITGAIVRRQPFGGWKRSAIGAGTKAGGPNYLFGLGSWAPASVTTTSQNPLDTRVQGILTAAKSASADLNQLATAAQLDEAAWRDEFGTARDVSALGVERNVFRYLPAPAGIRVSESATPTDAIRVVIAAVRAGNTAPVSSGIDLPAEVVRAAQNAGITITKQSDSAWLSTLKGTNLARIRVVGAPSSDPHAALGGRVDVALYTDPVTVAGRVEMLPFLREQAVAITAHRFGNPDSWSEGVL